MSFGRRTALLALVAIAAVLSEAGAAVAAGGATFPPPIPTVTEGTTTTTAPPTTTTQPPPAEDAVDPARTTTVGDPDKGPSETWTGAAVLALAVAGVSTVMTWRHQRAAR